VVPEVYHQFKLHGGLGIDLDPDDPFRWSDVDPDTTTFLQTVWNTYGGYTAWRLRNMTHEETPWREHWSDGARGAVILPGSMREFFASRAVGVSVPVHQA
jgi:uncharacterized phage-associated protein